MRFVRCRPGDGHLDLSSLAYSIPQNLDDQSPCPQASGTKCYRLKYIPARESKPHSTLGERLPSLSQQKPMSCPAIPRDSQQRNEAASSRAPTAAVVTVFKCYITTMPVIHVRPQVALWLQIPPRCDNRIESISRCNYLYTYMMLTGINSFNTNHHGIKENHGWQASTISIIFGGDFWRTSGKMPNSPTKFLDYSPK